MATYEPTQTQDVIPVQVLTGAEIAAGNYRLLERDPLFLTGDSIGAAVFATVGTNAQYATLTAALAANEKYIVVKPGTYTEPGQVDITGSDITIIGYGATFTEANSSGECFELSGNRITLIGVRVLGEFDGVTTGLGAAFYNEGDDNVIYRCTVENVSGFGVFNDAGQRLTVEHCRLLNVGTADDETKYVAAGIINFGTTGTRILNNYLTGWNQAIGLWYDCSGCVVANNKVINNLAYLDSGGPVPRSAFEDYGTTTPNRGNRWVNNYVDGSTGYCMEVASGCIGTIVEGNVFKNAGLGTVPVTGTSVIGVTGDGAGAGEWTIGTRIINNDIYGRNASLDNDKVTVNGHTRDTLFENNRFYNFKGDDATLEIIDPGTNTGVKIRNNTFRDGGALTHYVITVRCADAVIEGNEILSDIAGTRGIFDGAGTGGFRIINNTINVPYRALALAGNHLVRGNSLRSSGSDTVIICGSNNRFYENTIDDASGGGSCGFWIQGNQNEIKDNRILASVTGAGMHILLNTTDNRIEGNWFSRVANGETMRLQSSSRRNLVRNNTVVRPDNTIAITDQDATLSNKVDTNHTLVVIV